MSFSDVMTANSKTFDLSRRAMYFFDLHFMNNTANTCGVRKGGGGGEVNGRVSG